MAPPSEPNELLDSSEYAAQAATEGRKWGAHLDIEARGEMNAWLDHPVIAEHYFGRGLINGLDWKDWIPRHFGGSAHRSLDLGCGAASRSFALWRASASQLLEGIDISEERVAEGERLRSEMKIPGRFWCEDVNALALERNRYQVIFSAHSFHHFLALEHVMEQVAQALTPDGLFILEEFVGPTQFQWTDLQMNLTAGLLQLLPEHLRVLRRQAVKHLEGRPTVEEVVAVSPFESVRSTEIVPLFHQFFDVMVVRKLGGTIQHLLYNGIVYNFWPMTEEAERAIRSIAIIEDELVDNNLLPSDFMLLIGRRRI